MDLSFADAKLARTLSDDRAMKRAYGEMASRLRRRLDFLSAAPSLADVPHVPPTRCHALKGEWSGHFAVDITENWRLVFRPADNPVPTLPDGGVDLKAVTAAMIVAVVDYH